MKVFLSIEPRNKDGHQIKILHAQQSFYTQFGYNFEEMPLPLRELFSEANSRHDISVLERNIMGGSSGNEFVNLRSSANVDLPCHVTFGAGGVARARVPSGEEIVNRFTVLTIRSANVVGNAGAIGIMLTHPVKQSLLDVRIGVDGESSKALKPNGAPSACAQDTAAELEDKPPICRSSSGVSDVDSLA